MPVLKRFLSYYRPFKTLFIFDMLCSVVICAIDLAFPQLLNYLSKNVFTLSAEEILHSLLMIGVILLVIYLIRAYCRFFVTSYGHYMGARMESNMRSDLFDQYQRLSFSYYDQNNTGEMMSRLVSDLFDISELAHHGPENLLISALKIIGSFLLLLLINIPMTLILMALTLIMVAYSLWKQKQMQAVFMDNRKKIAAVNSRVQDSLSGVRVVKSFANEDVEHEKFTVSNMDFLRSKENSYRVMGEFQAGNNFFQGLLYVCVLVSGGFFIARGSLSAADLATYALYIGIFLGPIEVLINFTETFQKGFAGFKRFCDILETVPDVKNRPGASPLEMVRGDICYNDVTFEYEKETAILEHLSLFIPAGKTVALVGPSGGGKTTICSLLPRFYEVKDGSITIDGRDIRDIDLKSLRDAIGIVQQDVYMFAGSIRENIAYGKPGATEEEIIAAAKNANIHDFIIGLEQGYDTFVGERGTRLSGGQKQRLAIARVFLKNPKILILDEATSALDNESERHIQASLERLSEGRTTIVIAHRLSTIRNASEIIVITDSGIQERGSHHELMEKGGIYARYYNMQFTFGETGV